MRREMSPREVVFRKFRSLEKRFEDLRRIAGDADERFKFEMFEDFMRETRDLSLSFTVEAGPARAERLELLLDQETPHRAVAFVERHLRRQIPFMMIEGATDEALADACLKKLQAIDHAADFNDELKRISGEIVEEHDLPAKSWSTYSIESLCREAIGMDGRVPDANDMAAEQAAKRLIAQIALNHPETTLPSQG